MTYHIDEGTEKAFASTADGSGEHHSRHVTEFLDGSGVPTPVSPSEPMPSTDYASTSGGSSALHSRTLSDTQTDVKASAGNLYSFDAFNTSGADIFLKFYDLDSVNPASDTPLMVFQVSSGGGLERRFAKGIQFSNRIAVRAVTGLANTDTTSPSANDLLVNFEYK